MVSLLLIFGEIAQRVFVRVFDITAIHQLMPGKGWQREL
ncbi:hypothetical protein N185_16045 [Sinorhizobium sp. GW3]|nr:hypothetical protein N185_16045 [Sinorhizobium sp. GW3]